MPGEVINVVFVGDRFYSESGTVMSSIYRVGADGSLSRFDWGLVTIALKQGHEVRIKPANDEQYGKLSRRLAEVVVQNEKDRREYEKDL